MFQKDNLRAFTNRHFKIQIHFLDFISSRDFKAYFIYQKI